MCDNLRTKYGHMNELKIYVNQVLSLAEYAEV